MSRPNVEGFLMLERSVLQIVSETLQSTFRNLRKLLEKEWSTLTTQLCNLSNNAQGMSSSELTAAVKGLRSRVEKTQNAVSL